MFLRLYHFLLQLCSFEDMPLFPRSVALLRLASSLPVDLAKIVEMDEEVEIEEKLTEILKQNTTTAIEEILKRIEDSY